MCLRWFVWTRLKAVICRKVVNDDFDYDDDDDDDMVIDWFFPPVQVRSKKHFCARHLPQKIGELLFKRK